MKKERKRQEHILNRTIVKELELHAKNTIQNRFQAQKSNKRALDALIKQSNEEF